MAKSARLRRRFSLIFLLLGACGGSPAGEATCPTDGELRLELAASARTNPDLRGRALPTTVRVHQLGSVPPGISDLAPEVFWDASEPLAELVLRTDEFVAYPGFRSLPHPPREEGVTAIVAVARVHNPQRPTVVAITQLPEVAECDITVSSSTQVRFWLEAYTIRAEARLGCDSIACVSDRVDLESLISWSPTSRSTANGGVL